MLITFYRNIVSFSASEYWVGLYFKTNWKTWSRLYRIINCEAGDIALLMYLCFLFSFVPCYTLLIYFKFDITECQLLVCYYMFTYYHPFYCELLCFKSYINHVPYHKQQRRKSNLLRQNVMLPEGQAGADGGCRILKIPWLCADNKEYKTNIQGKKTIVWMCTWSVILYGYETRTMIKDVDTFEMWFYWRLTRSSWTEKGTNVQVFENGMEINEVLR